jgi:hypothetical protein
MKKRFEVFTAVKIQAEVFWVVVTLYGVTTQKTIKRIIKVT